MTGPDALASLRMEDALDVFSETADSFIFLNHLSLNSISI
jgi:hypothetical protein